MAVQLRVELEPRGETLCGRVTLAGEPPRGFTGWIGFNAAIDNLLAIATRAPRPNEQPKRSPQMAVKMVSTIPGMPAEAYDAIMAELAGAMLAAPGFVAHTAEVSPEALTVTEIWESREQWQTWYDESVRSHLPPDAPTPAISEVHNVVAP